MTDKFTFSGDFRGAIININATLDHAIQTLHCKPISDNVLRQSLEDLVSELKRQLETAQADNPDLARDIATNTDQLVQALAEPTHDHARMRVLGRALLDSAKAVVRAGPQIVTTADKIVDLIHKIRDGGVG